jgi:hypothetical protein
MTEPQLTLELDQPHRQYHPGDVLVGHFALAGAAPADIRAVELSVLWHTEGKGDEDMSVHYFERIAPQNGQPVDLRRGRRFSTVLPGSPLSYQGLILSICWRVRVRAFMARGKDLAEELPFQLGSVPQAQEVPP